MYPFDGSCKPKFREETASNQFKVLEFVFVEGNVQI